MPKFFEEGEWRVVPQLKKAAVKYRQGRAGHIPYVVLRVPLSTIARVLVGPNPSARFGLQDVKRLCRRVGLRVPVCESEIPFR